MLGIRRVAGATYHRIFLRGLENQPRIFCNSYPKSGTHLLKNMVSALPKLHSHNRGAYWNCVSRSRVDTRKSSALPAVVKKLSECLGGEVYQGHVEATPEISDCLQTHDFKTLFIYRDPRDVVVSLLYWWGQHTETDTWPYRYFRKLQSKDERLSFLIQGWPEKPKLAGFPEQIQFPDIANRFALYRPWLSEPSCLSVRFEDLRNLETRDLTCRRIVSHVLGDSQDMPIDSMVDRMIAGGAWNRSQTFRNGTGGEWRKLFKTDHIETFKHHAGQLLMELEYETDMDW